MACGPKRAPGRWEVPPSKGAPTMTAPAPLKLSGSSRSAGGTPAKVAFGPYMLPNLMPARLLCRPRGRQEWRGPAEARGGRAKSGQRGPRSGQRGQRSGQQRQGVVKEGQRGAKEGQRAAKEGPRSGQQGQRGAILGRQLTFGAIFGENRQLSRREPRIAPRVPTFAAKKTAPQPRQAIVACTSHGEPSEVLRVPTFAAKRRPRRSHARQLWPVPHTPSSPKCRESQHLP